MARTSVRGYTTQRVPAHVGNAVRRIMHGRTHAHTGEWHRTTRARWHCGAHTGSRSILHAPEKKGKPQTPARSVPVG